MARNVFALNPVEYELERQKAAKQGRGIFEQPKTQQKDQSGPALKPDGTPDFGKLAVEHQVPRNLIIALTDAAGLKDDGQKGAFATEAASRIGSEMAQGKDAKAALKSVLGEDAPVDDLISAAKDVPAYDRIGTEEDESATQKDLGDTSWSEREGNFFTDLYGGGAASLSAAAQAFGSDDLADYFNEIAEENAPAVASYKDVDNFGEAIRYVSGGIAQSLPEMALVAGATGATILTGGGALLAGGAALGSSALFNAGRAAQRQEEETGDIDYGRAWGAGVAMGTLDAIVPGKVGGAVSTAFKRRVSGAVADFMTRKGLGREALKSAGTEAITEVMQTMIEVGQADPDLLRVMVNPKDGEVEKSDQLITEMIDSALLGGAAGGAFGAGGEAARRLAGPGREDEEGSDDSAPPQVEQPPQQADPAQPPAPEGPLQGEVMPDEPPAPAPEPQGPIERAAQDAPGTLAGGMEEGTRISVQTADGQTFDADFVEETPNGVRLRDDTGPLMIPREDIESGAVSMGPVQRGTETGMFPDMKPGAEVALRDADGRDYSGVFLGEDQNGVSVRIAGQAVTLSPQEFDQARAAANGATPTPETEAGQSEAGEAAPTENDTSQPDPMTPSDEYEEQATPAAPVDLPRGVDPDDFNERAAILEEGAGMSRDQAEARALEMILSRMDEDAQRQAQDAIPDAQDMAETGQIEDAEAETGAEVQDPQPPVSSEGAEVAGEPNPPQNETATPVEDNPAPDAPDPEPAPSLQAQWWRSLPRIRKAAKDLGLSKEGLADSWSDKDALTRAVDEELRRRGDTAQLSGAEQGEVQQAPEMTDDQRLAAARDALRRINEPGYSGETVSQNGGEVRIGGVTLSSAEYDQIVAEPETDTTDVVEENTPEGETQEGQNEAGGAVPVEDARRNETMRQARETGAQARRDGDPRTPPEWMEGDISEAWLEGYGEAIAEGVERAEGEFVPAPNGTIDFGKISKEMAAAVGRQAGPIRLRRGDDSFGLAHIVARHDDQIKSLGFPSVEAFVESVASNFNAIYKREGRALDVVLDDGGKGLLIVQLEPSSDSDFYDVKTATPIRSNQYRNKTPLWERAGPRTPLAEASPLNPKGQNGNVSIDDAHTVGKATGILGSLSQEKQDRAAELKRRLAEKVRNQTSSGIDPEYITLGGELVTLYMEGGARKFGQMLRDFAETTGLSMREAQAPMRAAYNYVRDEKDLAGEDVSDMDSADQVMAEIRAALQGENEQSTERGADDTMSVELQEDNPDGTNGRNGPLGQEGEPEAGGRLADGERERGEPDQDLASQPSEDGTELGAAERSETGGARSDPQGAGSREDTSAVGDAPNGRAGASGEGMADEGVGEGTGERPSDLSRSPTAPRRARSPANYHIADPEKLIGGPPKQRFKRNQRAIEAFQDISEEGRDPTQEEIEAMAGYTGWGSFGQELFQGNWRVSRPKNGWESEDAWLREHLGQEQWESAQSSILNAHYTDPPTVQAMWSMVERMGFDGGRVLEPAMGIGNFFGLMPRPLEAKSDLTGIELDRLTGGMAQILYPRANISVKGYQESKTPDDFYDLVIGNWPFARQAPADRRYDSLSPSLHDYFFVKGLDQVRPGGLVVGITSSGTMDKQARSVRMHLAKNAELVSAFRLPSGAFKEYAGTAVVTDIIVLKKREQAIPVMQMSAEEQAWIDTEEVSTPSGQTVRVNKYFADNPAQVLGTLNFGRGTTFGRAGMVVDRPSNLAELLEQIPERLPKNVMTKASRGDEPRFVTNNTTDRVGSVIESKGDLYVSRGDVMTPLSDVVKYQVKDKNKNAAREDQLKRLVVLRKQYGALIDAERDGLSNVEELRAKLKKSYEEFRKAHGPIVDSDAITIMSKPAVRDPHVPTLRALENVDGTPSRVMTESTVRAVVRPENPTLRQAFVLARNENPNVDLERVADLAKVSVDQARDDLLASGAIYRTPGDGFEVSDVYLSGNVRRKMREAQDALARGEDMQGSIEALTKVIPEDIPYYQIEAKLGATWVSNDAYQKYIANRLGLSETAIDDITTRFTGGTWKIRFENKSFNHRPEAHTGAGHERVKFDKLFQAAMNNQTLKVYDKDRDGSQVLNEQATNEVNEKVAKLREDFSTWLWEDPERRVDMEFAYNEAMNAVAIPRYDGSFMDFPGMALKLGDQQFDLREHQVNAIWRGIANQRGLFAHEVGTGKTFTMGGIAVESRRYGLARKPIIFAHNANSGTVAAEINEMYPGAKVLYIDNLSPKEIDTQMRRIANDDWDAVVVPHSTIDRFSMREETLNELAREEIAAMEAEALAAAEEDGVPLKIEDMDDSEAMKKVRSPTAKDLVRERNKIIERIKKQAAKASRSGAIPFEDLGIDMIIVDEVHEFKKPPVTTKMQMKGLNTQTSQRATQLRFLTDYVKKQRAGKGVFSFTGTPITNTLTEIYNQMRFVMDDVMAEGGVKEWDAWFNTFAEAGTDVELAADGTYVPVTRLSSFVNVAELRRMAGEFMDIVFADDMPEFEKRKTEGGKTLASENLTDAERDELVNGRTENPVGRPYRKTVNDIAEMGPAQSNIMQDLVNRSSKFRGASPKEKREIQLRGDPEMPIRVETDAAKASLDVRLFDMRAMDETESKANRTVSNALRHYQEHPLATQAIFMERGFSDSATKTVRDENGEKTTERTPQLHLAKDIKQKLMDGGVLEGEIAIVDGSMNKAKRKEVASKMNEGAVRIVIGSTATLGVGVNMQRNLRAMHHLDAPWMPGDLTQRNGRGERQGNQWNTVLEYRYITEKLDGRRWQLLTIKDQFIRSFLKADQSTRVIEGDATSEQEGEDADELAQTLSDAAGDPRLLMINKLQNDVERLERRERAHTQGTVDAKRRAKFLREMMERDQTNLIPLKEDADHAVKVSENSTFEATIDGASYVDRKDALEALDEITDNITADMNAGQVKSLPVKINGFEFQVRNDPVTGPQYAITRKGTYPVGKPSIRSIEQTIRNLPGKAEAFETEKITERAESASRMEEASTQPFAQAETLEQKRKQLEAMQSDLEGNPVPPPAWLRNGAPADSMVYVDGEQLTVTGHRWDSDGYWVITDSGDVSYDRARDADGVRIFDDVEFTAPMVAEGANENTPRARKRAPDYDAAARDEITSAKEARRELTKMRADMRQELRKVGISAKISLKISDTAQSLPGFPPLDGYFLNGVIGVTTTGSESAGGILNHEIIHALRSKGLWGGDYGLFTQGEWRTLARAARKNKAIRERVERDYSEAPARVITEEIVAEMYREWMDARETNSAEGKVFDKMRRAIQALINTLRGNGMNEAAKVFEKIQSGEIGGRGPDGPGGGAGTGARAKKRGKPADPTSPRGVPMGSPKTWRKNGKQLWSDYLTDAMGGGKLGKYNILSLVPGRPLFEELGRNLPAAQAYLKLKEKMDALRQDWHAKTDDVAQKWINIAGRNTEANGQMMDLMHRSTLAGVDPSRPFSNEGYSRQERPQRQQSHERLKAEFDALPQNFQRMFRKVRKTYDTLADDFEAAVIENIEKAQKIAVKRAQRAYDKELRRVEDEGLTGQEREDAINEAKYKLDAAKARMGWAQRARTAELRQQFESNRLKGPYFPLARFGKYFVAARDDQGKIVSFSRFEAQRLQRDEAKALEEDGYTVESGVLGANDADLKQMVDPSFVADIEGIMADWDVEPAVMDTVWQRWLETLPDQSIRKNRIHRKGRKGFEPDALRAFTHHVFHGAHQLARLKYGLEMEEQINDAYDEAAKSRDPNRATLVVDEMNQRHQFTMNPNVSGWSTGLTSLGFIWYLGATPAAAMVNMTQTTVMGVPIMKAAFANASIGKITSHLARAGRDFASGGWKLEGAAESGRLTGEEKAALEEAYKRGTVDKTQAHELASVAESGVEYSGKREKVMKFFSYMFHKAEVFNREVTFLAAYRLARETGMPADNAINRASSVTWKTHFDYQGSSRARFMQGDVARVALLFRQHSVNVLYRMFRDTHQSLEGATEADRKEAKAQLVGITLSMMMHAGITGTWGYGLITMLLSMFFPGDDDDVDEWLHDALLLEGNSMGTAAWNYMAGMALKGIPGQVAGVDLTERIGMPNLWFRGPFYDMEVQDSVVHYAHEMLGPVAGIVFSLGRGAQYISEGKWWRGFEAAAPKIFNDISQGVRYGINGVETKNGDPILEDVSPYQSIIQAIGFTPAQLSERYEDNSRMRDKESAIENERRSLHRAAGNDIMEGKGLSKSTLNKIRAFNKKYPTFPITGATIRRSVKSRQRWSEGVIEGVNINPKLRREIEGTMAPRIYE